MTCIAAQIIGAKEFWQREHGNTSDANIKVSNDKTTCPYLELETKAHPKVRNHGEGPY